MVSASSMIPSTWSFKAVNALKPPCHHRREYGSPGLPWECQQSQSTAPASPCRRPMQLACLLHSNPSWGSYLVVCESPSCLPPCSLVVSILRKYFTLGGCCVSASEIFLFGRMWHFCNENASHGQINGSNEVMFGILLGGTVLILPVKRLRVVTSNRHPR